MTSERNGSNPVWLDSLGAVSGWKHTWNYPGGPTSASCGFVPAWARLDSPALRGGRLLRAFAGPVECWRGTLAMPDRSSDSGWSLSAAGTASDADDYPLNLANPYASTNASVDAAIAAGLAWTRTGSLVNATVATDGSAAPTVGATTLAGVLSMLVQQGYYWSLSASGVIGTSTSPPARSYLLYAPNPPARTVDGYFNRVDMTYVNDSGTTLFRSYPTAAEVAKYGPLPYQVDYTQAGKLTQTQVFGIRDRLLADFLVHGLPWAGAFVAVPGQLVSLGGTTITDLATVTGPLTVRVVSLASTDQIAGPVDVTIGQIDYDDASHTLTLTPLAYSPDSWRAAIARMYRLKLT
jgi:hypothetical protein